MNLMKSLIYQVLSSFFLCCFLSLLFGEVSIFSAQDGTTVQISLAGTTPEQKLKATSKTTRKAARLIFVGDIMVHATQLEIAHSSGTYNFHKCFEVIQPWLRGDLVIGNLETVLGGAKRGFSGYPCFNSPDMLATALRDAGFTTLLLANNHIYDHGLQAARRTAEVLQAHNFSVTGLAGVCPSPLILEVNGLRVGILNFTYGSNSPVKYHQSESISLNIIDKEKIAYDVAYLKKQDIDYIIATFHWGEEYSTAPSPAQHDIASYCLELGVDAIIGTHPHVLQPIEIQRIGTKDCVVAWSLGNFISSQRTLPRERAVILALDIVPDNDGASLKRVAVAPTWVDLNRTCKVVRVLPAIAEFFETSHRAQLFSGTHMMTDEKKRNFDIYKEKAVCFDKILFNRLSNVEMSIRAFLDLPTFLDEYGFYKVYEANDF